MRSHCKALGLAAQAVQAVQAIPVPHVVLELALTAVGGKSHPCSEVFGGLPSAFIQQ